MNHQQQQQYAIEYFVKFLKMPVIESLEAQSIIQIEGEFKQLLESLDIYGGFDWWVKFDKGIRGLASRIQWVEKSWDTWTIRKSKLSGNKTEYQKRTDAIAFEYLYPYYTLQAYITEDGGKLLSYAIAKTKDVISHIKEDQVRGQSDGTKFYYVKWEDVKNDACWTIIEKI